MPFASHVTVFEEFVASIVLAGTARIHLNWSNNETACCTSNGRGGTGDSNSDEEEDGGGGQMSSHG